ncbi:efflux RND transporter periplasmic adaptor subunit [Herbidospora cretacea]|uniref:efflux RND transporter periplasmic adaptor subunit n=1 Tax=Herbidospora cretacea TaxID=28444 RepID=UPI0004C34BEC|nr:HlyD family efflux transporter periplasmic adaptor subunit [Herbidospora cretacea]
MTRTRLRAGGLALAAVALVTTGVILLREDPPALPDVALVAAQRGDVTSVASAAGNTVDDGIHDLAFSTAGQIEKVYVKPGDKVRKGDLLARVDDTIARENHEAAKAALAAAEDQLDTVEGSGATGGSYSAPTPQASCPSPSPSPSRNARAAAVSFTRPPSPSEKPWPEVHLDPTREPSPSPSPAASPSATPQPEPPPCDQVEQQKPRRPQGGGTRLPRQQVGGGPQMTEAEAEAAVTRAKNDLNAAEDALKGVVIKAPSAGTVLQVNGAEGDQYTDGAFVSLGHLDDLQVKALFTQSDIGTLKTGQRAVITLTNPEGAYQGTVSHIDPVATTTDLLVRYGVTISFDDQPAGLRLGQTATVQVVTGRAPDAVHVPARAVQNDTVTLANGAKRKVTTGVRGDTTVEITGGLTEGEKVELPGASALNGEFPDSTFPGL